MLQLVGVVAMFFLIGGAVGTALFSTGLLDNRTHSPPRVTASTVPPARIAAAVVPVAQESGAGATPRPAAEQHTSPDRSAEHHLKADARHRHHSLKRSRVARTVRIDRHAGNF